MVEMPWSVPTEPTDDQKIASDREQIRRSIPDGWEKHHRRLTYGFEVADCAGDSPVYGVCGHGFVCLLAHTWRHPYQSAPVVCDDPPTVSHFGIR